VSDWVGWNNYSRTGTAADEFVIPRARGIIMEPEDRGLQAAVAWVLENVPENETIFVTHYRNDQFALTNMVFYFLAQRPLPTRYQEMDQGIATTAAVQQEIIGELEAHHTRFVIVDYGMEDPGDVPEGSHLLDNYLTQHFKLERTFRCPGAWWGSLGILVRRDGG
jgi:hypothetical protein